MVGRPSASIAELPAFVGEWDRNHDSSPIINLSETRMGDSQLLVVVRPLISSVQQDALLRTASMSSLRLPRQRRNLQNYAVAEGAQKPPRARVGTQERRPVRLDNPTHEAQPTWILNAQPEE